MDEIDTYRRQLLATMKDVLSGLGKTVADIPSNAWQHLEGQKIVTPHYILSHLLALESQEFNGHLHRIVDEDCPFIPLFDDDAWMADHYKVDAPVQEIIDEITTLRRQEVEWLQGLSPQDWSRLARHPRWGLRTLQWWVELQLDFSQQHLSELAAFAG